MRLVQLAHDMADKASTQGLKVLMVLCGEQCSTKDARTDEVQQSKAAMFLVTKVCIYKPLFKVQDQNLHGLMDTAAEEHVAALQRAEEASAAMASAPSLASGLVRLALCKRG